jgi:hypothetical protein
VLGIRVDEGTIDRLTTIAVNQGMMNKRGQPNISMAARMVLLQALRQVGPEGEGFADVCLANARAEWLEMVNGAWRAAMTEITKIGVGG